MKEGVEVYDQRFRFNSGTMRGKLEGSFVP
jgi:hypothetical protein